MLTPRLPSLGQHPGLYRSDDFGDLGLRKEHLRLALDVACVSPIHDIGRHRGLELTLSPEHDDRIELALLNPQEIGQGSGVPVVLMQRVLELELLAEEVLSPLRTLLVSVDPAVDILCLDDEYSVTRDDDVVDLGRPVRNGDCDIVDVDVRVGIKKELLCQGALNLTKPPLDCRFHRHFGQISTIVSPYAADERTMPRTNKNIGILFRFFRA